MKTTMTIMLMDVVGGDGDKCWRLCEVCVSVCVFARFESRQEGQKKVQVKRKSRKCERQSLLSWMIM